MHQRRIFIPPDLLNDDTLRVGGSEAHYLLRVLRLKEGDEVVAFDGKGQTCRAIIQSKDGGAVSLRVVERRRALKPAKEFSVAQAILKTQAIDTVIKRCTELGAAEIIGFCTDRSIPRIRNAKRTGTEKLLRWCKIAVETCRQCRRDFVPEIELFDSIDSLGETFNKFDHVIVASTCEGSEPLGGLLNSERLLKASKILVIIGPEGDFSDGELQSLIDRGALACKLSDAVLRAETAAIAASAIIGQHLLLA